VAGPRALPISVVAWASDHFLAEIATSFRLADAPDFNACTLLQIHGNADRTFPIRYINEDVTGLGRLSCVAYFASHGDDSRNSCIHWEVEPTVKVNERSVGSLAA